MSTKTTNVSPDELNYDSYETEKYDSDIVKSIPGHVELHKKIKEIFSDYSKNKKVKKILELGIGTGLTSEKILKIIPNAKLIGVDFSKTMLDGAKKRLSKYDVKFIQGDYSEINFENDFDVVISVIGIHHQNNSGKKDLFKKIYDVLKQNGIFIFGDLVTYKDEKEAAYNDAKHYAYLSEHAEDEKSLKEWAHHHKFLNLLAPLEDQIEWLKKAGFSKVNVEFKKFNTALIVAIK